MYFLTKLNNLFISIDQLLLCKQKSKFIGTILSLLLIQFIVNLMNPVQGIRWLGIYRLPKSADHPVDSTAERFTPAECQKAANELGLRRRQARLCMHPRFGYAMLAVLRAAHAVGYHCPKTFSDRRWNCTSIHQLPHVSPELKRGTREQAIVHAFASSVLLFEIGRYCALNKIRYCSCGDEDGGYATTNYPSSHMYKNNNNLPRQQQHSQNRYNDYNNALVYNSGSHPMDSIETSKSNNIPMTDGQPTVSKFYWAGCSDNLRVAKEYTSLFLGFPNVQVMLPPPVELDNPNMNTMQDTNNQNRYKRSTYSSYVTESSFDTTHTADISEPFQNKFSDNYKTNENADDGDEEDENIEDDTDIDDSQLFHLQLEYTDRRRRNLHRSWSYQSTAQTNVYPPYNPVQQMYDSVEDEMNENQLDSHDQLYSDQRWSRRPRSKQGKKKSILRSLNRHNYLAGVVLMEANQKLVCKCHGVSGSCAQRVCFRQLRRIDTELMQKALKMRYLAAKQVTEGKNGELIAKTFIGNGFIDEVVKPEELVFSEHSPDYCNVEPQRGSVGTRDR
ncbi:Protein Wnt-7b isoform 1 [Schistosoma japonicum]|nr:Protein Wnt-7b isoform 1 [Schistosoma japonicum]